MPWAGRPTRPGKTITVVPQNLQSDSAEIADDKAGTLCAHYAHCAPMSTLCTPCTLHPQETKCAQVCTIKDPPASMLPAGRLHQNLAGRGLPVATMRPMQPRKTVLQKNRRDRHSVHTHVHLLHSDSLRGTELERA